MHITDKSARCSLEISHVISETGEYDSFLFQASVDLGHGVFNAKNLDVQFFDLPGFVNEVGRFVREGGGSARLEGTYESFLEISGGGRSVAVRFCVGDFGGGPFALTGSFEVEADALQSFLEQSRDLLESWRTYHPG